MQFIIKAMFAFLPGGPILSATATVAGAVLKFIAWIFKTGLDGLTKMLANPATIVTAGLIGLACLAGGWRLGKAWDAHLVRKAEKIVKERTAERDKAKSDLASAVAEIARWKEAHDATTRKAQDARLAAEFAEADARQRIEDAEIARRKAEAEARFARDSLARFRRVRKLGTGTRVSGGAGSAKDAQPGLLDGLQKILGGG